MERHLEALAQLGVDLVPVPARQPGDEDDVGGARDREQLGRALDDAQRQRAAGREPAVRSSADELAGSAAGSPPRRRCISR